MSRNLIYICDKCGKKTKCAHDVKLGLSKPKDLCPKCYKELKKWMQIKEEDEHYSIY